MSLPNKQGQIPTQLYDLISESHKGSRRLGDPVNDLKKAQARGTKIVNGTFGPGGPRKGGPLGELSRHPALQQLSELRVRNGRIDEEIFTFEPEPNTRHVHKRIVKPMAPDVCSVSRSELAFLRQNDPRNGNVMYMENTMFQSNPQIMVNPAQWNAIAVDEQLKMYKKCPEEYEKLTPREMFQNWKLEGVVESDGGAGCDPHTQTRSNKMVNIISKGDASVNSYWEDPMPNAKCYILVKKYDFRPNFTLNTRITGKGIGGIRQMTNSDVPIRPYQMGFFCLPFGGQIPLEALQYTDEKGFTRSDTLVIYVGTVLRTPLGQALFDNSYVSHDNLNNPGEGHAYVDSNEGISRAEITKLRLIMDIDDGVLPY